ncbi:MAG: DnaD domain-containing protein [Moorellales bacterium]
MPSITPEFLAAFGSALWEKGVVVVPNLLLSNYARLGLTEAEVMVILHLLRLQMIEGDRFPTPEKLSQFMALDPERVRELMASLMEKKMLKVVPDPEPTRSAYRYSWEDLLLNLAQLWLSEQANALALAEGSSEEGQLYLAFEQEFGRPLSPLESGQLTEWCHRYPHELIREALRLAVLRGVYNFRYIDSILRDWEKKNVRTLREAQELEARFRERRRKRSRESQSAEESWQDEKYKDLYLS